MGRPHRTDLPGAIHHVIARCDNREPWALEEGDFGVMRWFLERSAVRFKWRVAAYCIMRNHYHLVVQTPEGGLTKGLFYLNRGFAGWFNQKYDRVGHVFQDRYIAIRIVDEVHLVRAFRYTLRNPVAARIVRDPADWRWSSARAVVGRTAIPDWVDWQPVALILGGPDLILPFLYSGDDDGMDAHHLHQLNARPPLEVLALTRHEASGIARAHFLHRYRVDELAAHLRVSEELIRKALKAHAAHDGTWA
jgi:REP element-mobilizing transposase RayT